MTGILKKHGTSPNCFPTIEPLKYLFDLWDDGTDLGFEPPSEMDKNVEDDPAYEMDFDNNQTNEDGDFNANGQFTDQPVDRNIYIAVPWYDYSGVSAGSQSGFSHDHRQSKIRSTRAGKHRQQFSLEDSVI